MWIDLSIREMLYAIYLNHDKFNDKHTEQTACFLDLYLLHNIENRNCIKDGVINKHKNEQKR